MKTVSQHRDGLALVREVWFDSANGRKIHAEIIAPAHTGRPRGAALFVHWLGDAKTTNLTEFHSDALTLAQHGCVSLLIDAMWARPHWYDRIRLPATDYARSIEQVIDLRRSLDLLVRQPAVDPRRIAFVGHDFGAMYGAVLSGIDPRPRWYVLMAGNPSFSEWYLLFPKLHPPKNRAAYLAQMAPLDPALYLSESHAEEFLFQFSRRDDYIPLSRALQFTNAAPLPRGLFLYESDHSLHVPAAFDDRIGWLEKRLVP
ncbi:MAG: hypothetical protein DLM53_05835 [Candidatus Eremiobacter antarcticus]|nr:hypothetical protein [Candidatus Eremiobacteraeota bacterium]PZR62339.1 MAG: hypothetical protein DLM53_05835 [Candidatus Eremiobacter sp. RRmetagenome_bin22]